MPTTFKDVYTIAMDRVDENVEDIEALALNVIKNGVNQGYVLIASLLDKKLGTYTVGFEKMISLPVDLASIEKIEHDNLGYLGKSEYKVIETNCYFNTMGISNGDVTITYVKYPAKLVGDTDVVQLKDAYVNIPAIYGAYAYMLDKRKYGAAQLLLSEFNSYLPQTQVMKGGE